MKQICLYVFVFMVMLTEIIACNPNISKKSRLQKHDMILISAGEFRMGIDDIFANPDQQPEHAIYLKEYYIGRHEVTNAEYELFVMSKGYKKRDFWSEAGWNYITKTGILVPALWNLEGFSDPEQPVAGVSFYEAEAYACWAGMRLPTEAEWEKASRGTDRRIYPWGDLWESPMFYQALSRPFCVGKYPESASMYGIQEVSGNVWEWAEDWYSSTYYLDSPKHNPVGPETGVYKVLRGGSWATNRQQMKCTYRYMDLPSQRGLDVGFRLASNASD